MLEPSSQIVIAGTANLTWLPEREPISTIDLMCEAIENALNDAGSKSLIDITDQIFIPKGTWDNKNPGSSINKRFGIQAQNILFDLGILQSSLVKRAIEDVANNRSKCTIIVGGETKEQQKRLGGLLPKLNKTNTYISNQSPEWVRPDELVISRHEIDAGLIRASDQYALIENAYAYKNKLNRQQQTDLISHEWERMATIADSAKGAWRKNATEYLKEKGWGRPVSDPYHSNHVTQWNVNQAAAIIITTEEIAKTHGSSSHNWVYPEAIIESNNVTPLTERKDLTICEGITTISERLEVLTGKPASTRSVIELYSCFPIAVRMQSEGLELFNRDLSITGGMTFAGGPFNNFTLQGISCVAKKVREQEPDGLITSISGMLTKQGLITINAKQNSNNIVLDDVTELVKKQTKTVPSKSGISGEMSIVSSTVSHSIQTAQVFVIAESNENYRTIVTSKKREDIQKFIQATHVGEEINVKPDGTFEF